MEDLFKIDKIDGKGLGWIALQDIKAGTLIWKEKDKNLPEPLKSSRINHSCCSNAFAQIFSSEIEMRATAKIRYFF